MFSEGQGAMVQTRGEERFFCILSCNLLGDLGPIVDSGWAINIEQQILISIGHESNVLFRLLKSTPCNLP